MTDGRSYFMRRAAQERSAAANATCEKARDVHLEMAERYRSLAETSSEEPAEGEAAVTGASGLAGILFADFARDGTDCAAARSCSDKGSRGQDDD